MTDPQAPSVPTVKLPEEIEAAMRKWREAIRMTFLTVQGEEAEHAAYLALLAAIVKYGDERFMAGKTWQALEQLKEKAGVRPSADAIRQAFCGSDDD